MDVDGGGYLAEHLGKDKRKKDANWFKSTHFILGEDGNRVLQSQAQRQFQPPSSVGAAPNAYDANAMTRTHFLLGSERELGMTTANASYQPPGANFSPSTLDENTKEDLRKSHFNLGGDAGRYTTTNKRDYLPKKGSGDLNDQEERKIFMRKHNFNLGSDNNNFVSTNNASYKNHTGIGATNSSNTGDDIGRTHFRLGGESVPMRTTHQREFREKSAVFDGNKRDANSFHNTNFQFGDDKSNKISSSHMHFKYYPQGETSQLNREQLNQLRKEHFILGKHPSVFRTVNQATYGDHGMNAVAPVGNRQVTTASSVKIGDPNFNKTYFQTTYEVANQSRPLASVRMRLIYF